MMRGGWGDVLGDLGMEPEEDDPLVAETQRRFEERQERFLPRAQREELQQALARFSGRDPQYLFDDPPASAVQPPPRDARKAAQAKARKHKNKRKAESASRKANRRKRK
jgi:hypothetical protein